MNGRTILVIEDCDEIRGIVSRMLAMAGYEVQQANNVVHALESLATFRPDALVTDVVLPDGNVDDIISAAGDFRERIPVIAMSGYHRNGLGSMPGTVAYLEKPFKSVELIQAVDAACLKLAK